MSLLVEEENKDVLRRMSEGGDDLTAPRPVDFTFVFPDRASAASFADAIQSQSFQASEVENTGCVPELAWEVVATMEMAPELHAVTEIELGLGNLATGLGGRPDGWGFLGDIQAKDVDLYLHQQGLDTSTPSGRAMFGMLGVFAEFERAMIRERIMSGLRRTSKRSGRKPMAHDRLEAIRGSLANGAGIRATARLHRASPMTVTKIAREMAPSEAVAA